MSDLWSHMSIQPVVRRRTRNNEAPSRPPADSASFPLLPHAGYGKTPRAVALISDENTPYVRVSVVEKRRIPFEKECLCARAVCCERIRGAAMVSRTAGKEGGLTDNHPQSDGGTTDKSAAPLAHYLGRRVRRRAPGGVRSFGCKQARAATPRPLPLGRRRMRRRRESAAALYRRSLGADGQL